MNVENQSMKPKSKQIAKYVDNLPPCNAACPAGEDIQAWLIKARAGQFKEAWESLVQNNPMPAIHGRVCYHPCETNCNRKKYDSNVSIHCVERFLGDMALKEGWRCKPGSATGKKVLVVGAGPAGLSAAFHLRLFGHEVTIFEEFPKAGGMMLTGIPAYRLPRDVLQGEIDKILALGINIKFNQRVEDVIDERDRGGFDAVFLAIGAHYGKNVPFAAVDPCSVIDAVDYLREVAFDLRPSHSSRVVIYGGGNTAIDVARTAIRLGAKDVNIVYHRARKNMPAFDFEIEDSLQEGVKFHFLRTLVGINKNSVTFNINELDENNRPHATGEVTSIETDLVVLALSQLSDSEFLKQVPGIEFDWGNTVKVDETFMTGSVGIFAGGDMIPYDRSVTIAVGQGKHAARHIDAYLRGTGYVKHPKHDSATYERLHINEGKSTNLVEKAMLTSERINSFAEIIQGVSQDAAVAEAKRCFSCGNCFECDACYEICPVKAIEKLGVGKRYHIDTDTCIGCRRCYKRCPCGAIDMENRK